MSNRLIALLREWYPHRDASDWALGTVYHTEGPAYRKAGAMMLFSADGQQLGMLSGGCLESDIHRHARHSMLTQKAVTLCYDGSDEDDLAFQLGIGCGGTVNILLQPVTATNRYLELERLYQALQAFRRGYYYQLIPDAQGEVAVRFIDADTAPADHQARTVRLLEEGRQQWLSTPVGPPPHLLIAGGGIDARPLAAMAQLLGWRLSVWDPRPANARPEYFPLAERLLHGEAVELSRHVRTQCVNAAVLMSHNIRLDAQALRALQGCGLEYLALLGPQSRTARVMAEAGIPPGQSTPPLASPAGLDIGAELPETIALSILTECQAVLKKRDGRSLSGIVAP